jgi:hypothetical protein
MKVKSLFARLQIFLVSLTLVLGTLVFAPKSAFAATYLTQSAVMLYNMNAAATSKVAVQFKTSASNSTGNSDTLTFGAGGTLWTGGANGTIGASGSQTVSTADCATDFPSATVMPGTLSASSVPGSGTLTASTTATLSANTLYCVVFTFASAVTTPNATGQYTVSQTVGTDSATNDEIDIIANDQVVVSAVVPPIFTMALSANTDSFTTNLSNSATTGTTGITATFNTNAKTGWYMWGSDNNTGLRSATQAYTIASKTPGTNGSLSNGVEGYLSGLAAGGITQGTGAGVTSATKAYASSGAGNGSGLDGTNRMMASSTGTASGAIVTVKEYATISSITPAANDYSDTITLVGAGSF